MNEEKKGLITIKMPTPLIDIINCHVDIDELAEVILEEAETITVTGIDVKPYEVMLNKVIDQITFELGYKIAQMQSREAKIEAEERKLEQLEKAEEREKQ